MTWAAVLVGSAACYLLKLAGYLVPARVLEGAAARRVTVLLPVALLAALTAVQAVAVGTGVTVDARLAGLGAAAVALVLRAPFLVVVAAAALVAALTRAAGWLP